MTRRRSRRLTVGPERFRWSVGHRHGGPSGVDCQEVLTVFREKPAGGHFRFAFPLDGAVVHQGGVWRPGAGGPGTGGYLNLNLPGTVRALLDEARASGHSLTVGAAAEVDGRQFFDAVLARLGDR
ncbi:MAG: hypothetical protein QOF84_6125 [Streptomyces sp.]|jgi:hypothetical protein|nr:hypothetical protein [Streptomyces sp.]MDX6351335.1 hypothetical protein [Streptomyces sp.]